VVKKRVEAETPPEVFARLVRTAGTRAVLVGGQALAFWVRRYDLALPQQFTTVSADTDWLVQSSGDKRAVERFARTIRGRTWFPSEHALTALVGQAFFDVSDDEFINVDVIFKVLGIDAEAVRRRAVEAVHEGETLLVMHPLDVLRSRLVNLYRLVEKQTPKGCMQLAMAIDVARCFLREQASMLPTASLARRSPLQGYVSAIEQMALEDAGRKVAKRFGLHVCDAIDPSLIPAGPFWTKRWPQLRKLMSKDYAEQFTPPAA
jgi:hypothetical protein